MDRLIGIFLIIVAATSFATSPFLPVLPMVQAQTQILFFSSGLRLLQQF